jgi:hypothetical protein
VRDAEVQEFDTMFAVIENHVATEEESWRFRFAGGDVFAIFGEIIPTFRLEFLERLQNAFMRDGSGALIGECLVAVGVIAVLMRVENEFDWLVGDLADFRNHFVGARREIGVDDEHVIFENDPAVVAMAFAADVAFVKINVLGEGFDFIDFSEGIGGRKNCNASNDGKPGEFHAGICARQSEFVNAEWNLATGTELSKIRARFKGSPMTLLNRNLVRACIALLFTILTVHGGQMELLPGNAVRVAVGANMSERFAVDVSSNLVNWMQITNITPAAGQITFVNDPAQSDPARFFRVADADETFAITGYVDGGHYFGGVADVTVTESTTGKSVITDANGFFHFDQRFARTNLPVWVNATFPDSQVVQRRITGAQAGMFSLMQAPLGSYIPAFDFVDSTCHFKVTGGPRAGLEYTIRFYDARFEISGGISGQGVFNAFTPAQIYVTNAATGTSVANEILIWPNAASPVGGWFSGIPSPKGALAGNGNVMIERDIVAPVTLTGATYSVGAGEIQFLGDTCTLKWDGVITTNRYSATQKGNFWNVSLLGESTSRVFHLYFLTATNGSFKLETSTGLVVSGEMHLLKQSTIAAPPTLSSITVTTETAGIGSGLRYTVTLVGGATGTFAAIGAAGEPFGSGSYTYTPSGAQARLYMTFEGSPGDFDDMMLLFTQPPGSSAPNRFSGSQRIGSTVYPFTGTFTY